MFKDSRQKIEASNRRKKINHKINTLRTLSSQMRLKAS